MARKPTMNDVARIAGVGTMTVSRVLNGSEHVSAKTAERVRKAVAELGYHPNEMARALRNARSRTIGVLLPNLFDSFYASCAHHLNTVAKQHGYTVLLAITNDDPELEYTEARRMLQRHVEGIAVVTVDDSRSRLAEREFREVPMIALDRPLTTGGDQIVDTVVTENECGGKLATEHLIQVHGLKRIVFLGHKKGLYTMRQRSAGYAAAMREAGLEPEMRFDCDSKEAATEILSAAMASKQPPQAIFSANNLTTRRILSALLKLRLNIPEEIALVGFDEIELGDLLHPALTIVRQPTEELGLTAGKILFAKLLHEQPLDVISETILPVELIIRHSCGCAYEPGGFSS